jgi:hypothetical protein
MEKYVSKVGRIKEIIGQIVPSVMPDELHLVS